MQIIYKYSEIRQWFSQKECYKKTFWCSDGQQARKTNCSWGTLHLSAGNKYLEGSFHGLEKQLARKPLQMYKNDIYNQNPDERVTGVWSRTREWDVCFVKAQMSQLCIWFIDCVVRRCSSVHIEPYSINLTAMTPLRLKLSPPWGGNVEVDFSHSHGGLRS